MSEPAKLAIRRDFQRPSAAQVKALAVWTAERMSDVDQARRTYDEARAARTRAQ